MSLLRQEKKFDELLRSLDDDQLEDAYSIADKMAWAASGDTIAADKVSEDIMALAIARQTKGVEGKEEREALARSVQEAFGRTALESTYKDDL